MNNQEQYEDAVQRLAECGYEVVPTEQGYLVRHVTNSQDSSRMHNLDELVEHAELMEWAQQRQRTLK